MRLSITILIMACILFTSCNKNYSNESITMTMVSCTNGNYYYTSQDYICGCENDELNYVMYNLPVKASAIFKNDNKYRKFNLNKQQIQENNERQKLLIDAKKCSCKCNGTTYTAWSNNPQLTCDQICTLVCKDAEKINNELALK